MKWLDSLNAQLRTLSCLPSQLAVQGRVIDRLVRLGTRMQGFHYFSGIGKNGYVAEKVSSTFNSLGIRSAFVDPVHSLHGDMGMFRSSDIVYLITKSGETKELIQFATSLVSLGIREIALVTSKPKSRLGRIAKHVICVPVPHEGDHLDLAPVASSLSYMLVLQSIGVEISSRRGFSRRDFVRYHPGGSLGRTRI